MEPRCEHTTLTIPNDSAYAAIASKYVQEVARKIGFGDQEIQAIGSGVEKAILNLIDYSFEPGERANIEISCERVPEGPKESGSSLPVYCPEPHPAGMH